MRRICVFCGSQTGAPVYAAIARRLGETLAERGLGLVYGGARVGLMGAVADAALDRGGEVIGVIPRALMGKESAHKGLSDLRIVGSMHERKALMSELADGFVGLPGGLGTLEEFFETWTWAQLGLHRKPFGMLNAAGYFNHLIAFLDHMVGQKLLKEKNRAMLMVEEDPDKLLDRFAAYRPPRVEKAIGRKEA